MSLVIWSHAIQILPKEEICSAEEAHGMGIKKLYKFWRFLYCIEFCGAAGRHSGCRKSALHIRIEEIEKFPSMLFENVARSDF